MGYEYVPVHGVEEATEALVRYGEGGRLMAGGVALGILMKQRVYSPECLIDLGGVEEARFVKAADGGGIRVGALATHRDMERSPLVCERFPILAEVFRNVATVRIRNAGTVGGNLCFAEPASDPPAAFLVLEAALRARNARGERTIPAREFFTGYYETALAPDEMLTEVEVPPLPPGFLWGYTRYTTRTKEDKPCVSVSVLLSLEEGSATCREVRVGLGGVEAASRRLTTLEEALRGETLTEGRLREATSAVAGELEPLEDIRARADYRRRVAPVIIRRTIQQALARGPGGEEGR